MCIYRHIYMHMLLLFSHFTLQKVSSNLKDLHEHHQKLTTSNMFGTLFKPKFYIKCKKALKVTRTRIERIKKKREAVQRFMKNDIVEFLKGGYDVRAYDKAKDLLLDQTLSSCYDQIDDFCLCIADKVSIMRKQRQCPEECIEAVQSLMHAASIFADLPELRDLRSLFMKKYGDYLQRGVNEEFLEKLMATRPAKELKLQLMHDIALEASIDWDSKSLQQKLFVPPLPNKEKSYEVKSTKHYTKDEHKPLQESSGHTTAEKESQDAVNKLDNMGKCTAMRGSEKDDQPYEVKDATLRIDNHSVSGKDKVHGITVESYLGKEAEMQKFTCPEAGCNDKANSKRGLSYLNIPPPYKKLGEHQSACTKFRVLDMENVNGKNRDDGLIQGNPVSIQRNSKQPLDYEVGVKETANEFGKVEGLHGSDDTGWSRSRRTGKALPTARAASLSPQHINRTKASEVKTRHNRTASLEPEMLARHVHPKLPDYDELALQFAALKRRQS